MLSVSNRRESGFTLVELLVVIVLIGILAAIAIPVFTSQRGRANDAQVKSDVKSIAAAAEAYLTDSTKTVADLSKASIEYRSSALVSWDIKGNATTNGYCISALHPSGKSHKSTPLTYDSTAGGLGTSTGSCAGTSAGVSNTPIPSGSTAVGSAIAYPATIYNASGSGINGSARSYAVTTAGYYKIEAWGASGGSGTANTSSSISRLGAKGAYASADVYLNAGQSLDVRVGQMGSDGLYGGGGGGGTYVALNASTPLVVAGGGGGGNYDGTNSANPPTPGSLSANGMSTAGYAGGSGGYGGAGADGSGGGGWLYIGNGGSYAYGGGSYATGGNGGDIFYGNSCLGGPGGYGGGGGGGCGDGGGGGGYSGGASASNNYGGGGGGSFTATSFNERAVTNAVTNNTDKANAGHGKVVITRVS